MKHFIHPELACAKFEAAANGQAPQFATQLDKEPRVRELVFFLQWHSFQDGGLEGLAARIIAGHPAAFQTKTMLALGGQETFSNEERETILDEIPDGSDWLENRLWARARPQRDGGFFGERKSNADGRRFIATLNRPEFAKICFDYAAEFLTGALRDMCAIANRCFDPLWFCPDLLALLLRVMDDAPAQALATIARTSVSDAILDALHFCREQRGLVRIDGNARVGKTTALRAYCQGRPGATRLVNTHPIDGDYEFFVSIGDAFGLPRDYNCKLRVLRGKVEKLVHYSGVALIFDEGHFILPGSAYRASRPTRLNWIRCCLVDQGLPTCLVFTPQTLDGELSRCKSVNELILNQVDGRCKRHVRLADALTVADVLAVVRHKAPHFALEFQDIIAGAAGRAVKHKDAVSYFAAVQSITDTAKWFASRHGRQQPTLEELRRAIAETAPAAAAASGQSTPDAPAPLALPDLPRVPRKPKTSPRALPAVPPVAMEMPGRGTQPALTAPARGMTPATQPLTTA